MVCRLWLPRKGFSALSSMPSSDPARREEERAAQHLAAATRTETFGKDAIGVIMRQFDTNGDGVFSIVE